MLQIAAGNEAHWRKVAALLGIDAEQPRYATNRDRFLHRDELIADMEKALAAHDRAHWLAELSAAGVPAGAIRTLDEVYTWEQTRSQGLVVQVDHPVLGPIELPGPPLRFDGEPPTTHTAPPALGQDGPAVLAWLEERER
ncbi:hypothetical protein GCM10020001_015020 [Nonomuraea salmonea]